MQLSNPSFKFGSTAVLAYPDTTRLAGYRSALLLLKSLTAEHGLNDSDQCKFSVGVKPTELAIPTPGNNRIADTYEEIPVFLSTPSSAPSVTFCFVNGVPAQERVPELVDCIVSFLEEYGVEQVVVPAAADLTGVKGSDRLWVRAFGTASDEDSSADSKKTGETGCTFELPSNANTNDIFLSALGTILCVSEFKCSKLLVYSDKRPIGSGYREKVVFGQEFVDETDTSVVGVLHHALAEALRVPVASQQKAVEVARVQLDPESTSRELPPAFG
ncbi:hypothetical protein IW140_001748 [Coemansia sp. RSA 1813]|nr:hypothetical protein EV178_001542 [Coemansia sp. RSA 1646]KAJ1772476.1 hypothetical protein LPJ74_001376 [Coemansia sp. RSA 1843]KAJ2090880.1 hypothetical protein IW138_002283 [Coemansia sp. RSA 986]KAJ2213175.1 hypothetical protein EV179_004050 [Coemansia sp. RSA 487]KAJ2571293.1 hypothetical protein IW140_001748 [Coemansia sp. RSA 1813]